MSADRLRPPSRTGPRKKISGPRLRARTIVIIDDEFNLADVLAAALSDVGFRVQTAANGVQGLSIVAECLPDLVILDYMMPLLDGSSVLRTMSSNDRLARIPVLMMSSLPEAAIKSRCSGYVAFLRKPFDFDTVLAAIRGATASKREARSTRTADGAGSQKTRSACKPRAIHCGANGRASMVTYSTCPPRPRCGIT